MGKTDTVAAVLLGIIKWGAAFLLGWWMALGIPSQKAIAGLCWLMAIDFATGIMAAYKSRKITSRQGFIGMRRKLLTLILIFTIHMFEQAFGIELHLEFMGALGFGFNEFVSILENCRTCGVNIPSRLVEGLLTVKRLNPPTAPKEQLDELFDDKA